MAKASSMVRALAIGIVTLGVSVCAASAVATTRPLHMKDHPTTTHQPLTESRTALVNFETAPFPYNGLVPGTSRPFLNVEENGRLGHTTPYGRVYWADETYSDNRVLLHLPAGFDIGKPSVMIVYLHGHGAMLERDVWQRQRLPQQISESGANAVLVAPQFALDAADSSAGGFWQPGAFGLFIAEAASQLAKLHGGHKAVRVFTSMPVVVVAYSGGYQAASYCIKEGGLLKRVRGLVLMDALYGEVYRFADWIRKDRRAFFVSTYLGTTEGRNAELATLLDDAGIPYESELQPVLKPGSVTIMPGGMDVTHRELITKAWVRSPIADLLVRMPQYRR